VHLAPAQLGRADPLLPAQGNRRAASAHRRADGSVALRVEKEGIEAWFKLDAAELLGAEAAHYDKISDTLDVWFDSGTTHKHVLRGSHNDGHPEGPRADLYLEGSDQHRGWFHSSLLTGCAIDGHAPYRSLLTHGFAVDGAGRKMSKSLGNVVVPQEVTGKLGAEILRLWVASTDYSGELSISKEILDRVVEVYRRMRNTLRFLLANTADFDIARDAVPLEQWLDIDRYALAFTRQLRSRPRPTTRRWSSTASCRRCRCSAPRTSAPSTSTSSRTACTPPPPAACRAAPRRPRCGTSLQTLLKLMAPILSFTAEEAWAILNPAKAGEEPDSVMLHTFHALPAQEGEAGLIARWETIRAVRAEGLKVIEALRTEGKVGASLQAELELALTADKFAAMASLGEDLRFVTMTSAARCPRSPARKTSASSPRPSAAQKCERCWHYVESVGSHAEHPTLCGRCVSNLFGGGETRTHA
jgi:isoleucyl-tRNA synthetase